MGKYFEVYRDEQNRKRRALSMEWYFGAGGYLYFSPTMLVMFHRFKKKYFPLPVPGSDKPVELEKEFIFRFQLGQDPEPRFSFFTLEAINPYDARIFYTVLKLTSQMNVKMILNLGWRLTKKSKILMDQLVTAAERRTVKAAVTMLKAKLNDGPQDFLKVVKEAQGGTVSR